MNISRRAFEEGTGWEVKPEGACKGDICIPLPEEARLDDNTIDIGIVADAMQMPIAKAEKEELWALGPASIGGRALATAKAPDLELPDLDGNLVKLSDLVGKKIVVYAWAPY